MKSKWLFTASLLGLLVLAAPVQLAAQAQNSHSTRYKVTDLGPVGPTPGQAFFITGNSLVSGAAATSTGKEHAVVWYRKRRFDIGRPGLGGPNSAAFGVNFRGFVVGEAETSAADPNGEDFCGFSALGFHSSDICKPFLWNRGVMAPLPTLGGPNGAANMINRLGEVAGLAESAARDPNCPAPQVLQFKPVLWKGGVVHELPTFAGDPDGVALAVNNRRQAAGASGVCSTFNPSLLVNLQALHALLWEKDGVKDLGNLGGSGIGFGNMALNLNDRGQVVGFSDLKGDMEFHAFLWTKAKGMRDLGTLPGDVNSSALAINVKGEIVGVSLDANFNPRAFLWRNGAMTSLNALIPAGHRLILLLACSINYRGEITGLAVDKYTGEAHAYLAQPVRAE